MSVKERVAKGAALLDRVEPDWYKHIDRSKLQMDNCITCVLGQCFSLKSISAYENTLRDRLGINSFGTREADHGFNQYLPPRGLGDTYHNLTDAWIEEINKRFEHKEQS